MANRFTPTTPSIEATTAALDRLAKLTRGGSGASFAAKSILLYAWNQNHPIHDFYKLDSGNKAAAVTIINRVWAIDPNLIESVVPEIRAWQIEAATED